MGSGGGSTVSSYMHKYVPVNAVGGQSTHVINLSKQRQSSQGGRVWQAICNCRHYKYCRCSLRA